MARHGLSLRAKKPLSSRRSIIGTIISVRRVLIGLLSLLSAVANILVSRMHTDGLHSAAVTGRPTLQEGSNETTLAKLFDRTDNGELIEFARRQLWHLNPSLMKRSNAVRFGTPSLARDGFKRGRTVLGFRIEAPTMVNGEGRNIAGLANSNFFMLCELKHPPDDTLCQDSGIFPWAIPPQCDYRYWLNPAQRTFWGFVTNGPEDARLFFDGRGSLWTLFGGRGCHEGTPFNRTNPVYSLYVMKWDEVEMDENGGTIWVPNGIPSLLDLRNKDGASLGNGYPSVTKSWIPIPSASGDNIADSKGGVYLHLLLGFTRDMASSVVYEVRFQPNVQTSLVRPYKNNPEISKADTGSFRGSTNLIFFNGYLLGVGHPAKRNKYFFYWYLICPNPPFKPIARSELFNGRTPEYYSNKNMSDVTVSFALGLALEGGTLYITWSENDNNPILSAWESSRIYDLLKNSSLPPSLLKEPSDPCST